MEENANLGGVDSGANQAEIMLNQQQVNDILKREKAAAFDKGRRELQEEYARNMQTMQTSQPSPQVNMEQLYE